jgi:hypothetical protein
MHIIKDDHSMWRTTACRNDLPLLQEQHSAGNSLLTPRAGGRCPSAYLREQRQPTLLVHGLASCS